MALAVGLLVLRYGLLLGLLSFVAVVLWQMVRHMPMPVSVAGQNMPHPSPTTAPGPPPTKRPAPANEAERRQPVESEPQAAGQRAAPTSGAAAGRRRASSVSAVLVVVDPGGASVAPGDVLPVRDKTHIGRGPSNTVVLDAPHVSRVHAFIGRHRSGWVLVDKGSANGTFLNGRRVTRPVALRDGDQIMFGAVKVTFRLHSPQE